MADAHANFAYSTVAAAPSPAASGLSLQLAAGTGALFPTPPFNATVWPAGVQPLAANAEIVRVTGISTDTLTITRTQESSTARTVLVGDQIAATITKKTLTDAEAGSSPVQVVGPFPVTYTDLTATSVTLGFVVTSFAAATIVLDVWSEPVTRWDNADMRFQLSLYNGDLYVNQVDLYNSPPQLTGIIDPDFPSDFVNVSNGWDVVQNQAFNSGDGLRVPARIRVGGCDLVATVDSKTGNPTQGQFDVYALLYVPA